MLTDAHAVFVVALTNLFHLPNTNRNRTDHSDGADQRSVQSAVYGSQTSDQFGSSRFGR